MLQVLWVQLRDDAIHKLPSSFTAFDNQTRSAGEMITKGIKPTWSENLS
jgi:hypothetical protein